MTPNELWDSLINDVYTITNREDLDVETALGVRNGIIRAHLCEQFPRDVQTSLITNSSISTTLFTIDTSANFPRFRTVADVKLLDVDGLAMDAPTVEVVELNDIYEPNYPGIKKPYIAYQAGTNLNIYAACGTYGAQVQWLQSPNITRDTIDSWIAQMIPDVIIWEAAVFIWGRTGNTEKAREGMITLKGTQTNPETGLYSLLKSNFGLLAGR